MKHFFVICKIKILYKKRYFHTYKDTMKYLSGQSNCLGSLCEINCKHIIPSTEFGFENSLLDTVKKYWSEFKKKIEPVLLHESRKRDTPSNSLIFLTLLQHLPFEISWNDTKLWSWHKLRKFLSQLQGGRSHKTRWTTTDPRM